MIDITDVILHKKWKQSIFVYIYIDIYIYIYIYIIEFKQIGFSSEVSLMYKQDKGFQKGRAREEDHSDWSAAVCCVWCRACAPRNPLGSPLPAKLPKSVTDTAILAPVIRWWCVVVRRASKSTPRLPTDTSLIKESGSAILSLFEGRSQSLLTHTPPSWPRSVW